MAKKFMGQSQIPLSFGTAKREVYVPDGFTKERLFGVPSYLMERLRQEDKELIIYDSKTEELMVLNVFELYVDSKDISQDYHSYQQGTYRFHYHKFIPNNDDNFKELLTKTERTLLKRFHWTWYNALKDVIDGDELRKVTKTIQEYRVKGDEIFPEKDKVFNCFKLDMNLIRVVLMAQDPYPNDNANGYAFATSNGYCPPSLRKIEDALKREYETTSKLKTDLLDWHKQGVLLLNGALTVRKGEPNSHYDLWCIFMKQVVTQINLLPKPVGVIIAGTKGHKYYGNKFNVTKHHVILVEHPAKAHLEEREWNHQNCFSDVNDFLTQGKVTFSFQDVKPIKWI